MAVNQREYVLSHKSYFNVFLNMYYLLWSVLGGREIKFTEEDNKDYIAAYRFV